MIFEIFPVGPFQCNCAILGCEETRSAVVIDPGEDADRILARLIHHQLKTVYLLHTHAHIDHIGATDAVRQKTDAESALHEDDLFLCQNLKLQADYFNLPEPSVPVIDRFLKHGEILSFGTGRIHVIHTPGHTPGSVTLHLPDVGLFTGDTLFNGSIGRTDLWGGSQQTLIDSITTRLFSFPDPTQVYPGHGPRTTIGDEKRDNPFVGVMRWS
jgi:glyoxylase-like metal-dependent hydrolase (beta-lactamase superfamily II)